MKDCTGRAISEVPLRVPGYVSHRIPDEQCLGGGLRSLLSAREGCLLGQVILAFEDPTSDIQISSQPEALESCCIACVSLLT